MKISILVLGLFGLVWATPQKTFQSHFEEFLRICVVLEGAHFGRQTGAYMAFPEFQGGLNAIDKPIDLKQLARDLENLDEYKAIVDFLKKYTVDVDYYIDRFEQFVAKVNANNPGASAMSHPRRQRRHPITGRTLYTSIVDTVSMLPRRQLRALFYEKMALDESFRSVIEAVKSDEFQKLYDALWENTTFQTVTSVLAERDFDIKYILENLVPAIFGQNTPLYVSFQMQFDEFLDIIVDLEGPHFVRQLAMAYMTFPEFLQAVAEIDKADLIGTYVKLGSVPDFVAVDTFLKKHDIFVAYWIDRFEVMIDVLNEDAKAFPKTGVAHPKRVRRHPITGRTLKTCIIDTVSLLPRKQLRYLYNAKMADNKVFRTAVEALQSDEWKQLYNTLWENETFKNISETLLKSDFDVKYVIEELAPALFGQNIPIYFSFQNQFDEFLELIVDAVGKDFANQVAAYLKFPEFKSSLEFLDKTDILQIYQDFQKMTEFKTLDTYLKGKDIFIAYYMDRFQLLVDLMNTNVTRDGFGEGAYTRDSKLSVTGTTMSSFLTDFMNALPKSTLDSLYTKKMSENEEFITAVNGLRSEEYKKLYNALWENETFRDTAAKFAANDFDLRHIVEVFVPALYGQS